MKQLRFVFYGNFKELRILEIQERITPDYVVDFVRNVVMFLAAMHICTSRQLFDYFLSLIPPPVYTHARSHTHTRARAVRGGYWDSIALPVVSVGCGYTDNIALPVVSVRCGYRDSIALPVVSVRCGYWDSTALPVVYQWAVFTQTQPLATTMAVLILRCGSPSWINL